MKQYNVWRWLSISLVAMVCAIGTTLAISTDRDPAGEDVDSGNRPRLAVSIRPLAMIVRELVGDQVEIHQLIDAGQDPHHGALQPSRRLLLEQADLVVWVGPGLESFLTRPLGNLAGEKQVVWLSGHGFGSQGDHHHPAGEDPHPWLAPDKVLAFSRDLAVALVNQYPSLAAHVQARLPLLEQQLEQQATALVQRMMPLRGRAFIAEHAAYGAFVTFAGLMEAGSLSDSSGVAQGARNLRAIKARTDVACVAVEQAPGSRLTIQLASELGVPVVEIDPFGTLLPVDASYSDLLDSVAAGFEQCLAGE